ncbi:MAG: hypothetical protein LAP40_28630 [Acidobacteriia bacterium]|nr:hypothetical protein [Terriglobia bacterium]
MGLSGAIWLLNDLMLLGLICRARQGSYWGEYPYYFTYLTCVLASDLIRLLVRVAYARAYGQEYWISEFITAIIGFGVAWEVYDHVFSRFRGAKRMARSVLSILLIAIVMNAFVKLAGDPLNRLVPTTQDLLRNIRVAQVFLLVALLSLIVHYRLPMGRNVRYLLVGYGLYIGIHMVTLTLPSEFLTAEGGGDALAGLEYCVTLCIWCVGMWSYHPDPTPGFSLELDYERVSRQTTRAFGRLRDYLTDSWRA